MLINIPEGTKLEDIDFDYIKNELLKLPLDIFGAFISTMEGMEIELIYGRNGNRAYLMRDNKNKVENNVK